MDSSTKILVGALGTALLSIGGHSLGSVGSSFVDKLEQNASSSINNIAGVSVAFDRDPAETRNAILSGNVSKENREKAIIMVEKIDGIGNVRWANDISDESSTAASTQTSPGGSGYAIDNERAKHDKTDNASSNGNIGTAASDQQTTKCQGDINAVMDGKEINFRSGSAYVGASNFELLDTVAAALKPCIGVRLEIQGHTDLMGGAAVNQSVSDARAQSVKAALVERGLNADMITAKGYGGTQPIENSRSVSANARNRRTIFQISSAN